MTREDLMIVLEDAEALLADGFDDALIGVASGAGINTVAIYDTTKCIEVLEKQGMSNEDARDYFSFNVLGAYMGKSTPLFVDLIDEEGGADAAETTGLNLHPGGSADIGG